MPEIQHLALLAGKTRAIHRIGLALQDGLDQPPVIAWIVFEVCILKDDDVSGHFLDGPTQGSAFAQVLRLSEDLNFGMFGRQPLCNLPGAVGRTVIHQDEFPSQTVWQGRCQHLLHAAAQGRLFIVGSHQQ